MLLVYPYFFLFLLILILQPTVSVLEIRLFKVDFIPNFEYKAVIKTSSSSLVKLSVHKTTTAWSSKKQKKPVSHYSMS